MNVCIFMYICLCMCSCVRVLNVGQAANHTVGPLCCLIRWWASRVESYSHTVCTHTHIQYSVISQTQSLLQTVYFPAGCWSTAREKKLPAASTLFVFLYLSGSHTLTFSVLPFRDPHMWTSSTMAY